MKVQKLVYLLFSLLLLCSCGTSKDAVSRKAEKQSEELVSYASKFLNTPYRSGGTTPKGFDCSGYVQYVYKKFGYSLPRSSNDQMNNGIPVKNNKLKKGDLVFFTGSNKKSKNAGHVGIVTKTRKNGQFQFIHASNSGVRIDDSELAYYKIRYLRAKRILY